MRIGIGDIAGIGDMSCDDAGNCYDTGSTSSAIDTSTLMTGSNPTAAELNQPIYSTGSTTATASSSPSWLTSLISSLSQTGASLTKVYATRNAVPQLNPGESITQLANGTYQVTQNASGVATGASLTSGLSVAGLSSSTLLLIGGGLLLVMMNNKK